MSSTSSSVSPFRLCTYGRHGMIDKQECVVITADVLPDEETIKILDLIVLEGQFLFEVF